MIDEYDFGLMIVSGKRYTKDLIIHGDRVVKDEWWRREGHELHIEDIKDIVERSKPETLVVGTGYHGLMKIQPKTIEYLESRGVNLIAENTPKAYKIYNEKSKAEDAMGAFHLTC